MILDRARKVLEIEAEALKRLASDLDEAFEKAVSLILKSEGRVILTGIGKSGIIARKIAATFASTGTPAFYLHPAEAIHGDLGMVVRGDTVIALSNSGETQELVGLLEYMKRQGAGLIAMTGKPKSTLARFADISLIYHIEEEGCPLGLAPMASTTVTLALGDALSAAVMDARGFTSRDFAKFHPGGKLGKKLLLVEEVVNRHGDAKPMVSADTILSEALIEMTRHRMGMTAVDLKDEGLGLISDGDIRRLIQEHGNQALNRPVGEICTRNPKTIRGKQLAVEALELMERHKITSLIVVDEAGVYSGVVHLHDLWQTQMV